MISTQGLQSSGRHSYKGLRQPACFKFKVSCLVELKQIHYGSLRAPLLPNFNVEVLSRPALCALAPQIFGNKFQKPNQNSCQKSNKQQMNSPIFNLGDPN